MDKMEKKLEKKVSVSYVYDPESLSLECNVTYNGLKDGFCAMFDDHPHRQTIHDLVDGFVQFLHEKQQQQQ